jgi:hypothetical protein
MRIEIAIALDAQAAIQSLWNRNAPEALYLSSHHDLLLDKPQTLVCAHELKEL